MALHDSITCDALQIVPVEIQNHTNGDEGDSTDNTDEIDDI